MRRYLRLWKTIDNIFLYLFKRLRLFWRIRLFINEFIMEAIYEISGIILRPAKPDDLLHFDDLAAGEHFDLGLHNWQLYYSLSPEDFWVLIDPKNQKIVGIFTGNMLSDRLFWGQQIVISPEYRMRKLFSKLFEILLSNKLFSGNRNKNSIAAMRHEPCYFAHKQIGFTGECSSKLFWPVEPPAGIKIAKLESNQSLVDPKLLKNLYNYDDFLYTNLPMVKQKRRSWLVQWLFPENPDHSYSVIAYRPSDSTVCGYCVVRLQTTYYSIAPLYADSEEIAYALLCFLANRFRNHEQIYLEFHANRRSCMKFVTEAKMSLTYSNFRVYNPMVPDLPIDKLYCDNEFWPI